MDGISITVLVTLLVRFDLFGALRLYSLDGGFRDDICDRVKWKEGMGNLRRIKKILSKLLFLCDR